MQILRKYLNPLFFDLFEKTKKQYLVASEGLDEKELLNILNTYIAKLSSGYVKRFVSKVLNEKYIEFSFVKEKVFPNYCVIKENPFSDDIKFVVLIPIPRNVDINLNCKKEKECIEKLNELAKIIVSENVKDIVYSIYQEMIRWAILKHFNKVKYDTESLVLSSKIFSSFLVKVFGKKYTPILNQDVIKLIYMVVFFVVCSDLLKIEPKQALEYTIDTFSKFDSYKEVVKKFKELIKDIKYEKYASFKEIANLLSEMHLISISQIKFNFVITQELSVKLYIDMIASIGGFISNLIIAKYPVEYSSKKLVIADLNDKLEEIVVKEYLAKTF